MIFGDHVAACFGEGAERTDVNNDGQRRARLPLKHEWVENGEGECYVDIEGHQHLQPCARCDLVACQ